MTSNLQGWRILILEDEYLLATDIARWLGAVGAEIVGPFANSAVAIDALSATRPDAALVDVNVGGAQSFELAQALSDAKIPFAFVTAYETLPPQWRHVPHLVKPVEESGVFNALRRLPS